VAEFCRALISAFAESGYARTPEAAANVMLNAVRKLQEQMATSSSRDPQISRDR
jgi:hypothetical protein